MPAPLPRAFSVPCAGGRGARAGDGEEAERFLPTADEVRAAELESPTRHPPPMHAEEPASPHAGLVTPRPLLRSNSSPAPHSIQAALADAAQIAPFAAASDMDVDEAFKSPAPATLSEHNAFAVGCASSGQLGTGAVADRNATAMAVVGVRRWAGIDFGDAHAAGVSESGDVYTWGSFELGQLGGAEGTLPVEERAAGLLAQPRRLQALDGRRALAVSCGSDHTAVVVEAPGAAHGAGGEIITWGSDEHGACGQGADAKGHVRAIAKPRPVPALKGIAVVQVACGATHTLAVTDRACVFAWGGNAEGQLGVGHNEDVRTPVEVADLWGVPVVRVAAGGAHSACITSAGSLLAWGSNRRGELGVPDNSGDVPTRGDATHGNGQNAPAKRRRTHRVNQRMLEAMVDMGLSRAEAERALDETGGVAVEVALEWHFQHGAEAAAATAASGVAAAEARAAEGGGCALRTASTAPLRRSSVPRRVAGISVATHVALGASHTAVVALTSDGGRALYTCGLGRDGALGHGCLDDERTPRAVAFFKGMDISDVACGNQHTLVLASPTAGGPPNVYGFGSTEYGQLGSTFGVANRQSSPVALFPSWFKSMAPLKPGAVSAGGQSGCVVMADAAAAAEVARRPAWESDPGRAVTELRETLLDQLAAPQGAAEESRAASAVLSALGSVAAVSMRFGQLMPAAGSGASSSGEARNALGVDFNAVEKFYATVLSGSCDSLVHSLLSGMTNLLDDMQRNHRRFVQSGSNPTYSERVRVFLVALHSPLVSIGETNGLLYPRCVDLVTRLYYLVAHLPMTPCKSLLIRWLSEYDVDILRDRILKPLQDFLTQRLEQTRQVDQSVVDVVRVMHIVERANQLSEALPMEAFYNAFVSEKLDVRSEYMKWRKSEELEDEDRVPFTFCHFPFLLDATAKRRILEMESKVRMSETVHRSRLEHMFGDATFLHQLFGMPVPHGVSPAEDGETVGRRKHVPRPGGGGGDDGASGSRERLSDRSTVDTPFLRAERRALGEGSTRAAAGATSDGTSELPRAESMQQPAPHLSEIPAEDPDHLIVRVRREHIIQDALDEVARQKPMDLFKPLRVHFIGEEGIDAGGVKKEFFGLLCEALTKSPLFEYHEESRLYWFRPDEICSGAAPAVPGAGASTSPELDPEFLAELTLVGICFGLAIYNQCLMGIPLPLAGYKLLLEDPESGSERAALNLKDLEVLSPTTASSLRSLLYYEETDAARVEDVFCLNFTAGFSHFGEHKELPLVPGGELINVTSVNRQEYAEKYVSFVLREGIRKQWAAFFNGFKVMCDGKGLFMLRPRELEALVNGTTRLDFAELKVGAKYEGGFGESSPVVQWLWEILAGNEEREGGDGMCFSLEARRRFLKFVTGCDRSPVGGLKSLKITIQRDGGADSQKLPTSHTCFNVLLMPEYPTKAQLYERLATAVDNSEGFGLR